MEKKMHFHSSRDSSCNISKAGCKHQQCRTSQWQKVLNGPNRWVSIDSSDNNTVLHQSVWWCWVQFPGQHGIAVVPWAVCVGVTGCLCAAGCPLCISLVCCGNQSAVRGVRLLCFPRGGLAVLAGEKKYSLTLQSVGQSSVMGGVWDLFRFHLL